MKPYFNFYLYENQPFLWKNDIKYTNDFNSRTRTVQGWAGKTFFQFYPPFSNNGIDKTR